MQIPNTKIPPNNCPVCGVDGFSPNCRLRGYTCGSYYVNINAGKAGFPSYQFNHFEPSCSKG